MPPEIRAGCDGLPPPLGGVVVGGDYVGLAIVRSLGRRGIPTCVIDDEYSIAQFSRYTTSAVRVATLRGEQETIESFSGSLSASMFRAGFSIRRVTRCRSHREKSRPAGVDVPPDDTRMDTNTVGLGQAQDVRARVSLRYPDSAHLVSAR